MTGFRERALSAVTWSVSGDIARQVIRFGFGVALARLLTPRDFGLLAMLTVFTQFVTAVSDLGFEDALVQKRDLVEAHRSSVFWALLVTGSVLTLGLIAAAPWIAALYGANELTPLAVVLSALFVLSALGTVPRAIVARRLDFRVAAWLQCAAATVAGTCAVVLAWRGCGVMSLAADLLVAMTLQSLLFFGVSGWRPQFEFRATALADLLGFSANRLAARTLTAAALVDQFFVGKFLGSGALGLYARAYNLTRFPVLYAIGRVMFPSLALIQDDTGRVQHVYLRATGAVAVVTFPMCLGLFAAAEPFVLGVLGAQWRETIPLVRLLSLASLVQSITSLASSLYLSQGRADLQFRLSGLQRLSTSAAILLSLRWGVVGVAAAYALATVLNALPTLHFAARLVHLRATAVLAHACPVFLAGSVMTAVVLGIGALAAPNVPPLELLGFEAVTGVLVYWIALRLFRVSAYLDVLDLLRRSSPSTEGAS